MLRYSVTIIIMVYEENFNEKQLKKLSRANKTLKDIDFSRTVSSKSDEKDFLIDLSWKDELINKEKQ